MSEIFYPEETSTGYLLSTIACALTRDFDVHALCGQPGYSKRGVIAPRKEVWNEIQIQRVAGTMFPKDHLLFRIINALTITLSMFTGALGRFRRGDVVFTVTNPPTFPFVIVVACLLRRCRAVLLVHDVYPNLLNAVGLVREEKLLYRFLQIVTRWTFRRFDRVLVIGRDMKTLVESYLPVPTNRVAFIPNWADDVEIQPVERSSTRLAVELGVERNFVALYAGNIGRPNDVETLLEAAARLHGSNVRFVFLGTGAKLPLIQRQVSSRALSNVIVTAPRPRTEQNDFLNCADLGVISLVRGMVGISVPSRAYNMMAAGRPLLAICEPECELARLIREEQLGWIVVPGDADGVVCAILEAQNNPARAREYGARGRRLAETRFSRAYVLEQYRSALNAMKATARDPSDTT